MCVVTKESNPELYSALFPEDRIKEILDFKDDSDYKRLSIEDILLLKEHIEKLEKKVELYQDTTTFGDYVGAINNLIELQCRINKAIEYITTHKYPTMYRISNDDLDKNDLIKILQGSDKE